MLNFKKLSSIAVIAGLIIALFAALYIYKPSGVPGVPEEFLAKNGVESTSGSAVDAKLLNIGIPFIENCGQLSDEIKFYANTFAGNFYLKDDGAMIYSIVKGDEGEVGVEKEKDGKISKNKRTKSVVFEERLVGSKDVKVEGKYKTGTKVNYFKGKKDNWKTNISTYESASLGEVYEGITLSLNAYGKNVEKVFTVSPEGNPSDIKLKVEGAKGLKVNDRGELEVKTEIASVAFSKPYIYQDIDGERVEIEGGFKVEESDGVYSYGFNIASYDKGHDLVIDPSLLYSTYIGGSGGDTAFSVAVDSSGNAYVVGNAGSSDFPVKNALDSTLSDSQDVFITKINSTGSSVV
ncbi:MAG: hypothetical protein D6734_06680, partial [Candidatus Schekmanbacteria bacterium]